MVSQEGQKQVWEQWVNRWIGREVAHVVTHPARLQPRHPEPCSQLCGTVPCPTWQELPYGNTKVKTSLRLGAKRADRSRGTAAGSLSHCGIASELTFHGHLGLHPNQNALAWFLLLGWLLSAVPLKLPVPLKPLGSSIAPLIASLSSM